MSKNIIFALAVSVVLNVFLGGFLIGSHLSRAPSFSPFSPRGGDMPPPPPEMMMFRMIEEKSSALSPEGQKSLSALLEKQKPVGPDAGFGEKMDEMRTILTAEKLDLPKLEALQKEIDATEEHHRKNEGLLIMEIAKTLSDKDRVLFFETLLPQRMGPPMGSPQDHPMGPPMGGPPHDDDFGGDFREFDEFSPTERR